MVLLYPLLLSPFYFHLPPLLLPANHILYHLSPERVNLEGTLYKPPEQLANHVRLSLDAIRIDRNDQSIPVVGKVQITVYESGGSLVYGDTVLVKEVRLRTPRGFWNPGGFNYSLFLQGEEIYVVGGVSRWSRLTLLRPSSSHSPSAFLYQLRSRLSRNIEEQIPSPFAPLLRSMVLGERGMLPRAVHEAFRRSGTAHLLAISGLHIGFIATTAFFLFRLIFSFLRFTLLQNRYLPFRPSRIAAVCTIVVILAYAHLVGGRISTVRATVVVVVYLTALLLDREKDLYTTLAFAALLVLLWNPSALFAVSFQLSFLSVFTIIFVLHGIEKYYPFPMPGPTLPLKERVGRKCWIYGVLTLFTTLATVPLLWWHFNHITPYAPLANFLIVPWASIIVPLGLMASLLALLSPLLSQPLFWLTTHCLWGISLLVQFFADLPWASLRVPTPRLFTIITFYAVLFFLVRFTRVGQRLGWKGFLLSLLLLILLVWDSTGYYTHHGTLRVTFLDVGQGEAILLEFPNNTSMLIDGGGSFSDDFDFGESVVAPFLWGKGMTTIDTVVLSHPHADHYKGLDFILHTFYVHQFWDNGSSVTTPQYLALRARAKALGIYRQFEEPVHFPPVDFGGVSVQVLHPSQRFTTQLETHYSSEDERFINNRSLVLFIRYGEVSFLFTGDLEVEGEKALLEAYGDKLRTTILKVPHHGSRTSSSKVFLQAVQPEVAVFSVGALNWHHFPHAQILSRYQERRSRILRTDEQGAIEIVTDGRDYTVRVYADTFSHLTQHGLPSKELWTRER